MQHTALQPKCALSDLKLLPEQALICRSVVNHLRICPVALSVVVVLRQSNPSSPVLFQSLAVLLMNVSMCVSVTQWPRLAR